MHPAEQRLLGCAYPPLPSSTRCISKEKVAKHCNNCCRLACHRHYALRCTLTFPNGDFRPLTVSTGKVLRLWFKLRERGAWRHQNVCWKSSNMAKEHLLKTKKKGFHSSLPRIGMLGRYSERLCQACYPHAQMRFICWEKCKHAQLVGRRTQKIWTAEITHNRL